MSEIKKPGFFSYLVAFVAPPLSFFMQGKIVAGIISAILMFIALPFLFVGFGFIVWFVMSMWACFSLGNKMVDARVQEQANKTAEAIVAAQRRERQAEGV